MLFSNYKKNLSLSFKIKKLRKSISSKTNLSLSLIILQMVRKRKDIYKPLLTEYLKTNWENYKNFHKRSSKILFSGLKIKNFHLMLKLSLWKEKLKKKNGKKKKTTDKYSRINGKKKVRPRNLQNNLTSILQIFQAWSIDRMKSISFVRMKMLIWNLNRIKI